MNKAAENARDAASRLRGCELQLQYFDRDVWAALTPLWKNPERRKVFAEGVALQVKQWLLEGDTDSIAKFGRAVEEAGLPQPSQASRVFAWVGKLYLEEGIAFPTVEEMVKASGIPRRTVQKAYKRISKESGECLDKRKAGNIWS